MKKSIKSPKKTKKVAASKDTSETSFNVKYNFSAVKDPTGITSLVHLTRKFARVKRETKDFPSEFIKIMEGRFFVFIKNFQATVPRPISNDKWEENINRGILKEVAFLKTEQLAFKERYSISLEESIKKAQQGDDISIFSLVEWDKAGLLKILFKISSLKDKPKVIESFLESLEMP